jgi:glycosyltransferase involved in cell wall biosynthesis
MPAALSSKKVLSVGHFNDAKRRDLLIEAWAHVHKIHTDWQLQIVGDGPEKERCIKMINDLGLNQSISIIDPTDQIEDYYLNSSVFVLSSEFESFSLVLLEAKIAGLPCVSFDIVCGPNELINEAEDGFLVPFPNTKYMSEKICTLIEDLDLRKKMGASGRVDAIKRYNPETIYQDWDNFLTTN